jgi:type I restriction enzyme S subunit
MKRKWKKATLGALVTLQRGYDLTDAERGPGSIPVLGGGGPNGTHSVASIKGPGVVIGRSGAGFGKAWWCDQDYWAHNTVLFVKDFQGNDPRYAYYVLDSIDFSQFNSGGAQPSLNRNFIYPIELGIPPLVEQERIAAILRTWDDAIDKLECLSQSLTKLSAALCQRIFEKEYAAGKHLRRASTVFETVSEKARPDLPLLAVMQDLGVVRRDELDRRVAMPDGDTSNYKVVRPDDFVISLRSFEGGLEYSNVLGLVSPAYTVLRKIREINTDYYRHFFKSRSFIGRLDKMIFGIRDGKQIAFRDFGDMRIPSPRMDVQLNEAEILNDAKHQLELNRQRKQILEKQKRGLMQRLLTGEWRVKL